MTKRSSKENRLAMRAARLSRLEFESQYWWRCHRQLQYKQQLDSQPPPSKGDNHHLVKLEEAEDEKTTGSSGNY